MYKKYLSDSKKKIILKQIKNDFGSYTIAKNKAKKKWETYSKAMGKWRKLGKRKRLSTMPPYINSLYVLSKNKDYFLYYLKEPAGLHIFQGKGLYIGIFGPGGHVVDYYLDTKRS